MSKKVLAILLALVMVIGMLPVAALAAPIPETAEREQVERVEADLAQAISASEAPMVADVMEAGETSIPDDVYTINYTAVQAGIPPPVSWPARTFLRRSIICVPSARTEMAIRLTAPRPLTTQRGLASRSRAISL